MAKKELIKEEEIDLDLNSRMEEYKALDKQLAALGSGYKGITTRKGFEESLTYIPTGCISLDKAIKGIVPGRVYECFGPQGSGKSSLALYITSSMQRGGRVCLWIDAEACFTEEYAKACGVDIESLIVIRPENMNEALEAVRIAASSGLVGFIALDSVASLVPKDEFDKEVGGGMVATRARILSSVLPQIVKHCSDTKCIAFFINQERSANLTTPGVKSTTVGGAALPYYSSVRLDLNRCGWIEDKSGQKIGFEVSIVSVKNKTYTPFRKAQVSILYPSETNRGGIDLIADVVSNGIEEGLILKSGSWLTYGEERLQGEAKFRELLVEKPYLREEIRNKIMEISNGNKYQAKEENKEETL
jgi:recombination protein RecA